MNKKNIFFMSFTLFLISGCMLPLSGTCYVKDASLICQDKTNKTDTSSKKQSLSNNQTASNATTIAKKFDDIALTSNYKVPDLRKVSGWDISKLDTASSSSWSQIEKDIVLATNMVRTNPTKFSDDFLEPLVATFDGDIQTIDSVRIKTEEGKTALIEAINFLNNQKALSILNPSNGIRLGALDHVKDQGLKGLTGHTGTDGSQPWDRINRYGSWSGSTAENISYGVDTGLMTVVSLIVDDGVSNRGHRKNIFTSEFNFTGSACGDHSGYKIMCVLDYAKDYKDK